jgi:transketolase
MTGETKVKEMDRENLSYYEELARKVRLDIIKAVFHAGSGHPGGSLSCADILTALYFGEMNIDPQNPEMAGRDRFVLSKGHAVPAQYAVLGERGYYNVEDMMSLRKLGSNFQGHGNMQLVPGVEMSTGSLGQGFSVAVGMALADKMDQTGARVYTLLGDGEIQEGLIWEAAMAANHYGLSNLTAFVDWNGLQIDGENDEVMTVKPIDEKFRAFGWDVQVIDGHDFGQIFEALDHARAAEDKPSCIIARTVKGKGVSYMENQAGWHGKAPGEEQARKAVEELGGEW